MNTEFADILAPSEIIHLLDIDSMKVPQLRYQRQLTAYTRRKLTFQSDALNAFAGIQRAMSRLLFDTRFWYGLPSLIFDCAVLWSSVWESKTQLTRCEEFPSWTWAGWRGQLSPPFETNQEWLLKRTWIEWLIIAENGMCLLIWDPERDKVKESDLLQRVAIDAAFLWEITDDSEDVPELNDSKNDTNLGESREISGSVDPCPHYGWPSEGNPYGRLQSRPNFVLPQSRNSKDASQLTMQGLPIGTLVFSTISAIFSLSNKLLPSEASSRPTTFALLDKDEHIRGRTQ